MSFAPASVVRLLSGVPLDSTQQHTITFGSAAAQEQYFASKLLDQKVDLTYQREGLRVDYPAPYDNIINANYMMFQNPNPATGARSKWFYAFVVNKEYVSEECTRIYFEIDSYQTYMFDVTIRECFVEREHVADDTPGLHLIDEGLATGDYIATQSYAKWFTDWFIVVGATVDLNDSMFPDVGGNTYSGVYSGLRYFTYDPSSDQNQLESILTDLAEAGKSDAISSIYMIPQAIVPGGGGGDELPTGHVLQQMLDVPNSKKLDGYTPVNNKLLTYPYRGLYLTNNEGNATILRYEYFSGEPTIAYEGVASPTGRVIYYPYNYAGLLRNFDYSVALGNYPQCSWTKDVFANWNAVQSVRWGYTTERLVTNAIANLFRSAGEGYASGGGASAGLAAAGSVADAASNFYNASSSMREEREVHSMIPNTLQGSIGNSSANIGINAYGTQVEERTIRADYAKSIDAYFSAYGYKVNTLKVPNITGRPSWNFVKCSTANVTGRCPTPDVDNIKNMLLRGCTFWHGDFVGDYSRANK